jgi:hypothetical protein
MGQAKRVRGDDGHGRHRVALPGQDVDDDGGRADVVVERFLAGGLDGLEPIAEGLSDILCLRPVFVIG